MEQLERIAAMEARLNRLLQWQAELMRLLDALPQVREDEEILSDYLESGDWLLDYELDEAGLLPSDLKRGVLSEDGIWNLLTDCKELNNRLKKLAKKKQSRQ